MTHLEQLVDFVERRDTYISSISQRFYKNGTAEEQQKYFSSIFLRKKDELFAYFVNIKITNADEAAMTSEIMKSEYQKIGRVHQLRLECIKVIDELLKDVSPRESCPTYEPHIPWYAFSKKREQATINKLLELGYNVYDPDIVKALTEEQKVFDTNQKRTYKDVAKIMQAYRKSTQTANNQKSSEKNELALKAMAYARSTYFTDVQPLLPHIPIEQGRKHALEMIKRTKEESTDPRATEQLQKFEEELVLRNQIEHHQVAAKQSNGLKKFFHKAAAALKERRLQKKHNQHMHKSR